jgi:nucleoside-diphosphate kinase
MKTIIIIRPDAVIRGLVGEIITRFEKHGIRIAGLKIMHMTKKQAEDLYVQHKGKPFYDPLIKNMTTNPSVVVVLDTDVLDQETAISLVRKIIGDTDPANADMGTIRGDFGLRIDQNIIHASDTKESADREIPLFLKKEDLVKYDD